MKASEFGQSLLADVRQRNADYQRKAEKRAKRDQWKKLGLQLAMSVAEDMFAAKHAKLLNSEENMRNKLKVDTVYEEAMNFADLNKKASEHPGGEKDYYQKYLNGLVQNQMHNVYAPGTYNQTQFNAIASDITEGYMPTFMKAVKDRKNAHQKFISSGDREAYYNNIKQMYGDGSLGSGITQLIKKIPGVNALTGNPRQDLEDINTAIMARTNNLEKYQDAYKVVQDTELAKYIAQNLPTSGAGLPAPTLGTPHFMDTVDGFGNKIQVRAVDVIQKQPDGSTSITQMMITPQGGTSIGSSQKAAYLDFVSQASQLTDEQITPGKMMIDKLPEDLLLKLTEIRDDILKQSREITPNSGKQYVEAIEEMDKRLGASIAAAGLYAKQQGWGTPQQGRAIAYQILKDNLNSDNPSADPFVLGEEVPFKTMFAIYSAQKDGGNTTVNFSSNSGIAVLMSKRENLYRAYKDMTPPQREDLNKKLKENKYFENAVRPEFVESEMKMLELVFKHNLDDRNFKSIDAMFEKAVSIEKEEAAKQKVKVEKPKSVETFDVSKPPSGLFNRQTPKTPTNLSKTIQARKYKLLEKANQKLNEIKNSRDTKYKMLNNMQYQLILNNAQKEYTELYDAYQSAYPSDNNDSLLTS